ARDCIVPRSTPRSDRVSQAHDVKGKPAAWVLRPSFFALLNEMLPRLFHRVHCRAGFDLSGDLVKVRESLRSEQVIEVFGLLDQIVTYDVRDILINTCKPGVRRPTAGVLIELIVQVNLLHLVLTYNDRLPTV